MDDLKEEDGQTGMKLERRKVSYNTSTHIYSFEPIFKTPQKRKISFFLPNPNHGIIPDDESMDDVGQPKPTRF